MADNHGVQCPACGRTSDPGSSFCTGCGTSLTASCPACAAPASPDDAFCSNCGARLGGNDAPPSTDLARYVPAELQAKLEAARAGKAMAGERRTVTMLFADLQGSTAAAEQLDPEEWAEIVNGAFERLIGPVYRFEGTLARLMGDAVLAFFGAPIAHEDDPERAVRAGLEMLAAAGPYAAEIETRWGVTFDLRVGINTGLVVVGEVGSDLRVEYTAMGDAVNVAARMEQTARPGTLQISAATHRLVESLFEFEELEPVHAKGKSEPVTAYRVIGPRTRPATTRGLLGGDTPMIGRDSELDDLRRMVEDVRSGQGRICTVIGEAGVGKSRLVKAIESELGAADRFTPWQTERPDGLRWAEARCLSYDTSVAYAPFVDLFTRMFGLGPQTDFTVARRRVEEAVMVAGPPNPDLVVTDLCVLLGIEPTPEEQTALDDMEPPVLQRRVFSAAVGYLEACCSSTPGIIVFEDLHWADPVSLALLDELMHATGRTQLGIVALTRPYRQDAAWRFHETGAGAHADRYDSITLLPLDDDAAEHMVERLLGGDRLPDTLRTAILERADGNPFFVEEILRDLMESGTLALQDGTWTIRGDAGRITIPAGVTGLLTARLDRLEEASRFVAQLASVIGRDFEFDELAELAADIEQAETALDDLVARELIVERNDGLGRAFAFRHALIRETAYNAILLKSRRELHARVGEHLITRGAEPQEIARHLLESRQESRAVPFLVDAGDRAVRAMSLADAIRLYDQASTWLSEGADVELLRRVHEGLGAAHTLIPDLTGAAASYQQMLDLGRARSEPSIQISALNRLGFTAAFLGGDLEQASRYLDSARRLAEEVGDEAGLAEYHMNSCMIATTRGDMEAAAEHEADVTRLGTAVGSERLVVGGLLRRVLSLFLATRWEEGMRTLERAREATAGVTDPTVLATLAEAEAFSMLRDGRFADAWTLARDAAEEAARVESSVAAVLAFLAGGAAAMLGDPENALASHAQAIRFGEQAAQLYYSAGSAASMVHIYAELGIDDEQVTAVRASVDRYLAGPLGTMVESTVFAELGWAALERGDLTEASEMFTSGLAGSSATKPLETPSLMLGLALVEVATGDLIEAEQHVDDASAFTADRAMAQYRPLEAYVRGVVTQVRGRPADAAEIFAAGAADAQALGAGRLAWRLEAAAAGALTLAGADEQAVAATAAARRMIEELAARIIDPSIRESFVEVATARLDELVDSTL